MHMITGITVKYREIVIVFFTNCRYVYDEKICEEEKEEEEASDNDRVIHRLCNILFYYTSHR